MIRYFLTLFTVLFLPSRPADIVLLEQSSNPEIIFIEEPQFVSKSEINAFIEYDFKNEDIFSLLASEDYNFENVEVYDNLLNSDEPRSIDYALAFAKYPFVKGDFYENIQSVMNPDDVLVLVNKNFSLDEDYVPSELVLLDVALYSPYATDMRNYLHAEAAVAAREMFEAAYEELGYVLLARSGYRSYDEQIIVYEDYVRSGGAEYADMYSARPGHSEHQTGLALDVSSESVWKGYSSTFGSSKEYVWVYENAHRFGFIERYPYGFESETGYGYEPWHLRYVGVEAATEIFNNEILLEDYLLEYGLVQVSN